MIQAVVFYLFAAIAVFGALMVISSRNPVHSVLFLILTFVSSAVIFVTLGAEFVAMILVVVYVGAVAVLFLFVVMMLDINFAELKRGLLHYLPIGLAVGFIVLGELLAVLFGWVSAPETVAVAAAPTPEIAQLSNTKALGLLIYTKYAYLFQAAGMILLVAMIGSIVLTHRNRGGVKRQNSTRQFNRTREEAVALVKVKSGQGLPAGGTGE